MNIEGVVTAMISEYPFKLAMHIHWQLLVNTWWDQNLTNVSSQISSLNTKSTIYEDNFKPTRLRYGQGARYIISRSKIIRMTRDEHLKRTAKKTKTFKNINRKPPNFTRIFTQSPWEMRWYKYKHV